MTHPLSSPDSPFDVVLAGGGINGAGIARDLAGRGYRVALLEQGDLASQTSQWSSKLIHGGLRYLELGDLALVKDSLQERERLLASANHLVHPLRFVIPQAAGNRPRFILRLGLWLYDLLARPARAHRSGSLSLAGHPLAHILKSGPARSVLHYTDARTHDARLTVAVARDAARHGAAILTRHRVLSAARGPQGWSITARLADGAQATFTSRCLVNATGPFADRFIEDALGLPPPAHLRLVRGSHIVVPRIGAHEEALLLQNTDRRIVFVIPYEDRFTLIGTTDIDHKGDPADPEISEDEVRYLCAAANRYLAVPLREEDIVHRFAGVRPLINEGGGTARTTSREHRLYLDRDGPPLLSVYGGKLTTFRSLAEEVADTLTPLLPAREGKPAGWTRNARLPGAFSGDEERAAVLALLDSRAPALAGDRRARLVAAYGTEAPDVIGAGHDGEGHDADAPGPLACGGLSQREVRWLVEKEFALTVDDILDRRSHLGLIATDEDRRLVEGWIEGTAA